MSRTDAIAHGLSANSRPVPALIDLLLALGRHRTDTWFRLYRPGHADHPLYADLAAKGDLGALEILQDIGPAADEIRQQLIGFETNFVDSKADKPFQYHPAHWLCDWLLKEIGWSLDEQLGRPLERLDLEFVASRLHLYPDSWGVLTRVQLNLRPLVPKLKELDDSGVGKQLYERLVDRYPVVMKACGFATDNSPAASDVDAEHGGVAAGETVTTSARPVTQPEQAPFAVDPDDLMEAAQAVRALIRRDGGKALLIAEMMPCATSLPFRLEIPLRYQSLTFSEQCTLLAAVHDTRLAGEHIHPWRDRAQELAAQRGDGRHYRTELGATSGLMYEHLLWSVLKHWSMADLEVLREALRDVTRYIDEQLAAQADVETAQDGHGVDPPYFGPVAEAATAVARPKARPEQQRPASLDRDFAEFLIRLAAAIARLVRDEAVLRRFQAKVREWAAGVVAKHHATKNQEYRKPDENFPLPLPKLRDLSILEAYAVLAAIRDVAGKLGQINPYGDGKQSGDHDLNLEAINYYMLRELVVDIETEDESYLRELFVAVAKDLRDARILGKGTSTAKDDAVLEERTEAQLPVLDDDVAASDDAVRDSDEKSHGAGQGDKEAETVGDSIAADVVHEQQPNSVNPSWTSANGKVRAHQHQLFSPDFPDDVDLRDLAVRIDQANGSGKTLIQIAREFTGEAMGSDKKANRFLSRLRKQKIAKHYFPQTRT